VDLIGLVDGKYILMCIDYYMYSSYPEACIFKEIASLEVIKAIANIFSRFGIQKK